MQKLYTAIARADYLGREKFFFFSLLPESTHQKTISNTYLQEHRLLQGTLNSLSLSLFNPHHCSSSLQMSHIIYWKVSLPTARGLELDDL